MRDETLPTDLQWLKQIQQHNEQSLSLLMKKYYRDLYHYAAKFSDDDALVKDCIQEVFISLWQRRESAGAILSPRYYLLRAVKNKMLKSLHNNARKQGIQLQEEYEFSQEFSIERIIIEKQISEERADKLKRVLSQLSKRQKEVIYLKYYQYLDNGQVADLMNISRQSVYNLLHEAIQKLRVLIGDQLIS